MRVPFLNLQKQYQDLKSELEPSIMKIFEEGTFVLGKPVQEFENNIKTYLGQDSISCASGTDALVLALMACDVKPGDEVITTPFTFFATAGAISRLGAVPVFVDIDKDTFNIDANKIEEVITTKTKAIIPVHLFGQPADMNKIMIIARKHKLKVIEDACQAIGSEFENQKIGGIGDFGCFSFFPTKNLGGAGDGGLITCKTDTDFSYLMKARVHGSEKRYYHDFVGLNSRIDALQAVVLDVKLKYIDGWNDRRRAIALQYNNGLSHHYITPKIFPERKHVFHQYALLVDNHLRDKLLAHLQENSIDSGIYYPIPLHLQKCFSYLGYNKGDLPVTEDICGRILSLPIYPEMTNEQVEYVITVANDFIEKHS